MLCSDVPPDLPRIERPAPVLDAAASVALPPLLAADVDLSLGGGDEPVTGSVVAALAL